jgi:cardiolipin synthase
MEMPIWLLAVMVLVAALLGLMLWTTLRERRFFIPIPDLSGFEEALPSIAGMTKATIVEGNAVEVLQNGDGLFPRLFEDIAAARETIHFETFVWERGEICDRLANAFADRARAGLEVRLTVDAMGSNKRDPKLFDRMREAGCKVQLYHPIRLIDLGQLNKRTHRKLAIFDGRIGYTFGHGVSPHWLGDGQDREHWRDTGVRVRGPVVNGLQSVFAQHWIEESGEPLAGEKYFPYLDPAGESRIHVLAGTPLGGVSDLELMFKLAIATAQKELRIQNPYFIPDAQSVALLKNAVRRGVDVQIMIPGSVTDSPMVMHAGHHYFDDLIDNGVRIFEYEKTLTHQKIMVIDGLWSHVGSTNFDDRSFDINEEAGVGIVDERVAAELCEAFERDLAHCVEVSRETWKRRCTPWHRLVDRACYLVSAQL